MTWFENFTVTVGDGKRVLAVFRLGSVALFITFWIWLAGVANDIKSATGLRFTTIDWGTAVIISDRVNTPEHVAKHGAKMATLSEIRKEQLAVVNQYMSHTGQDSNITAEQILRMMARGAKD